MPATAQYASAGTSGRVVDADNGQPIEGAIVVARWEWLEFRRSRGGGVYVHDGSTVHTGETVSDRAGRWSIGPWGPVVRVGGMMDDAPVVLAFKPGYEPSQLGKGSEALALKRATGDPKAYAKLVQAFQGKLAWLSDPRGTAIPRTVQALHRLKVSLGADGDPILGAHRMPGRDGKGTVVDSDGKTISGVAWVEWPMRRVDGTPGTRRVVQTISPVSTSYSEAFYVSPWRLPGPAVAGWEIDSTVNPKVRVYPWRARRSEDVKWDEAGRTIRVQRLGDSRNALLAELRQRRHDIDAQLGLGDRAEALLLMQALLDQFDSQCRSLTPDLQAGLCYDPESDVGRTVYAARHRKERVEEAEGGLRIITRTPDPEPPPPTPPAVRRVQGFSIEPKP